MFKLAVICGGPTPERGISLNSARSLMDHLASQEIEIIPLYVDYEKNFYAISCGQLYSNTPADFDFKLSQTARKLDHDELADFLRQMDLVFPVIHGPFGEDGELQELLEKYKVPFVGSGSESCRNFFHKYFASSHLKKNGYPTLPSVFLPKDHLENRDLINAFFEEHQLKKAIIKPVVGGSSIGVSVVSTPQQAFDKSNELFNLNVFKGAILEPFCEGSEFTILVVESLGGEPIALLPTEIEMNYSGNQIFDYRKKYLPTNQAAYHTPPRYDVEITRQIRQQAQELFHLFNMRDFVRIDGWVMPDQTIYFTDINPISGLEQNSFLFRQSSLIGMTHQEILNHIVKRACLRNNIPFPNKNCEESEEKKPVFVLFGGNNAERQVSLMSGTNVWLKLRRSSKFKPTPFLYDPHGFIWQLPYSYALNHTVEEILHNCLYSGRKSIPIQNAIKAIQESLGIKFSPNHIPCKMDIEAFTSRAQREEAFVFIAMHGGVGENGTLQSFFERDQILFNGSDSKTSALCMDKFETGKAINQLGDPDIASLPKKILNFEMVSGFSSHDCAALWLVLKEALQTDCLLIKPRCDGCSAGIALLHNEEDLARYIGFIKQKTSSIPAGTFPNQKGIIEMPNQDEKIDYMVEPYIETDRISIEKNVLKHTFKKGWIELTIGVLEEEGNYKSLNPSITIAEGAVLSLEEKFQGGTGINLTPPPETIVSAKATLKIKKLVAKAAEALGIHNYCRIDIFFNLITEKVIVIEANTLPGLTPSTVIYHQGLAEEASLPPIALLEKIIASKKKSSESLTTCV